MTTLSKLIQQRLFPIRLSEKETNLQKWWNISFNFNAFSSMREEIFIEILYVLYRARYFVMEYRNRQY